MELNRIIFTCLFFSVVVLAQGNLESRPSKLPFFFYSNLKLFKTRETPVTSSNQFVDRFVNTITLKDNEENLKILLFNIKTEYDSY